MWLYQETIIKTPRSLTVKDINYSSAIFRDADLLTELGIVPYREERIDNRYYWTGNVTIKDGVGTFEKIDRDIEQLKKGMVSNVKEQVGSRLKSTDWMVIREMDGGDTMSDDVKLYRGAIRLQGNEKEIEINALSTLNEVIEYENREYIEIRKVKHTAEDGTETYGDETNESNREINMVMHFEAVDPLADVDPAFVSLTAK